MIQPLYEKILIKPLGTKEEKSEGGIVLLPLTPHSKVELRVGEVVAVGLGGERTDGQVETRPHLVKPGDRVVYAWAAAVPFRPSRSNPEEWHFVLVDGLYAILDVEAQADTERPPQAAE